MEFSESSASLRPKPKRSLSPTRQSFIPLDNSKVLSPNEYKNPSVRNWQMPFLLLSMQCLSNNNYHVSPLVNFARQNNANRSNLANCFLGKQQAINLYLYLPLKGFNLVFAEQSWFYYRSFDFNLWLVLLTKVIKSSKTKLAAKAHIDGRVKFRNVPRQNTTERNTGAQPLPYNAPNNN